MGWNPGSEYSVARDGGVDIGLGEHGLPMVDTVSRSVVIISEDENVAWLNIVNILSICWSCLMPIVFPTCRHCGEGGFPRSTWFHVDS